MAKRNRAQDKQGDFPEEVRLASIEVVSEHNQKKVATRRAIEDLLIERQLRLQDKDFVV